MSNAFTSSNYPEKEPEELIAGDRWAWKRTDLNADYDNSLYTLKYSARLEGVSGTSSIEIEITASASGNDYLIEVAAATTAAYTVGTYHWQAYITRDSDSERVTIQDGIFRIIADRDEATTDPRTHAKITLEAIEAVIENRATKDQMSYTIAGRSLGRMEIEDLMKFRMTYKAEVAVEDRAANSKGSRKVLVRL